MSGGYPGGTYTQTCDDISYDPNSRLLSAICQQLDYHKWIPTSMYLLSDYDDIANCDGKLTPNGCQ